MSQPWWREGKAEAQMTRDGVFDAEAEDGQREEATADGDGRC